jgi:biotin operon repressor
MGMTASLPNKRQTKKERIHQLVSDGQYTDEDIARMVGTTIPNVWKEKSTLRKSGVLVRHRIERSDRTLLVTSAAQGVYASQKKTASLEYQQLLNIPPIDSEGIKKLYTSIIAGKKPDEIIAAYGFHPAVVETEYHRSQKVRQDILSKRIIYEVLVLKTSAKGTALIDKYNEEGWISDDDMIELLKEYTESMFQLGMQAIPTGFRAVY